MSDSWLGLEQRVAAVSGGGGGIGRAICQALAAAGCRVGVLDLNLGLAEETAELVRADGGEAEAVKVDISDAASVTAAADAVERAFGPCSILVNNAALLRNGALSSLSLADWKAVIDVNLTGYFICSQEFGRRMRDARGGSIVHVSSIAGSMVQPTSGAYSVSKAGVNMLSQNLAQEWGEFGIRSNVVSPAMVRTPLTEVIYTDADVKARREKVVPVGRIGAPQDIADSVCFLASDRAGYVSGQEILCDGAWSTTLLTTVPRPGFDRPKT